MAASRSRGRPSFEMDEPAVLRAALEAFAEFGLQGTSMERVAERTGVAKTTLHDHFGSKSALYERAMEQEHEVLASHLLSAYAAGQELDMLEQLRNGYVALFSYAREKPAVFQLIFGDAGAPTLTSGSAMRGRRLVVDAVTQLVSSQSIAFGRTTGPSAEVTADVIVGSGEYVAMRLAREPDLDPDMITDFMVEILSRGIFGTDPETAARIDGLSGA